jgi:hypothetical protein
MDRRIASTGGWLARQGAAGMSRLAGAEAPAAVGATGAYLTPEIEALMAALRRRTGGPSLVPVMADEGPPK